LLLESNQTGGNSLIFHVDPSRLVNKAIGNTKIRSWSKTCDDCNTQTKQNWDATFL